MDFLKTLTAKERLKYDSWSKEDIYEAYVLEHKKSQELTKEIHRLNHILARIRHEAR